MQGVRLRRIGNFKTEGETARLIIKMVTRNAQVGQQTVDLINSVVAHPLLEIPEVAPDESKPLVVDDVLFGIGILVETIEMSIWPQVLQYFPAVTTTAKSDVDIDTVRLDSQPVNAFFPKHWYMVCLRRDNHLFSISLQEMSPAP